MPREYATNAAISRTPRLSFGVVGAVFCPVRVKSLEHASSQRAKRPCRHGRQRHDQRQAHRARACTQHVRHQELAQQAAPSPAAGRCVARGLSLRCAREQCAPAASFSLLAAGGGRAIDDERQGTAATGLVRSCACSWFVRCCCAKREGCPSLAAVRSPPCPRAPQAMSERAPGCQRCPAWYPRCRCRAPSARP